MRFNQLNSLHRKCLPFLLVVLFVLFFFGGPSYHSPRHFVAFWNLGHILFFALLSYQLFSRDRWLAGRFPAQALAILGICLTLGVLVELFQYDFHRMPDTRDIFRDVIGGLVGIFFLLGSRKVLRAKVLAAFQIITLGLVGLQVYPVLMALADEFLAREQLPVLSGFETPWEVARWRGGAAFAVDHSVHLDGKCSLRVQLGTGRYSGVALKYFPGNWQRARSFRFSIYNPSKQALTMTCRIHDQEHEKGRQQYSDRFNRQYALVMGWNTIDIDIKDIREAPKSRLMDMGRIRGVGIFAMNLPQPRVVYIDDVRLVY